MFHKKKYISLRLKEYLVVRFIHFSLKNETWSKHRDHIFHTCKAAESALMLYSLVHNNILKLNLHHMIMPELLMLIK